LFELNPADYKAWAYGLKKAGYATNIKYSEILIKLIETYNLNEYTLFALNEKANKKENEDLAGVKSKPKKEKNNAPLPTPLPPSPPPTPAVVEEVIPAAAYPAKEFEINKTKVIFVQPGTSLLALATQYEIPLARLLDFNDLLADQPLKKAQLIYLQRKRKVGNNEFHTVAIGETLYDICQTEALRMEALLAYNQLSAGMQVAIGEKVYLQAPAAARPLLAHQKK
jgi:LysM repeat protein